MIVDYFSMGVKNLTRRKLRSWLTMLGIFISIAIIFVLISVSLGLEAAVTEQFRTLGTDKFYIYPSLDAGMPGADHPVKMYMADVEVIKSTNGVKYVAYFTIGTGRVEFADKTRYFMILGMPSDDPAVMKVLYESNTLKIDQGKFLESSDNGKILIGYDFKYNNVFPRAVEAGDSMEINDVPLKVAGIVGQIGNPQDDKQIYMPLTDFKKIFGSGDRVDTMIIQIQPGADINEVVDRVERKLRAFRNVDEKTQDFTISTPEEMIASFKQILNIITAFLLGVAAISLVVGGIGIANTMYTSVLERTKEIGVMKAVGAKNSDILLIFLVESGLLGLVGGIIGVVLGYVLGKIIEYIAIVQLKTTLLQTVTPWYLIVGCLLFAFLAGALSGIIPAWQASKIRPVQALRYE